MVRSQLSVLDGDPIDQLAGMTGLGWTASILAYLATLLEGGNGVIARLLVHPESLLYIGGILFLTTVGLDYLQRTRVGRSNES